MVNPHSDRASRTLPPRLLMADTDNEPTQLQRQQQLPPPIAPQQFSLDVLQEKYAKGDEQTADDVYRRVARGVAMAEPEPLRPAIEARFVENLQNGALGAGRIMSAAGSGIAATLI